MNLLCHIPNVLDGTSLYRAGGPLHTLARQGHVHLGINLDLTWANLKSSDAVFLQRPYLETHLEMLRFAKLNKKATWIDFDDNLFAVPLCNFRYMQYSYPQIHHAMAAMIAVADVVTVTTPYLANVLQKLLKQFPDEKEFNKDPEKIMVVPNAYDPELHPSLTESKGKREKLVVWRGSHSHGKDLAIFGDVLADVIGQYGEWRYEFMGEPFWGAMEAIKKKAKPNTVTVSAPIDPIKFYNRLNEMRPSIMIVPLEDQSFNRSKSNIAWIEAVAAGAVVLAPDWEEWRRPGVILYSDIADFQETLAGFLQGEINPEPLWQQSRDYILTHLTLDHINEKRRKILDTLNEKSKQMRRL